MKGKLGALAERDFRLVFSSTTISAIGDGVAYIALAFAVLHISHDSPTAVGVPEMSPVRQQYHAIRCSVPRSG